MALRLRRGTDTERQLIIPLEGELVYATDTKELYIGDGTTTGGIRVTGEVVDTINQLDDVDAALPQDGDVLIYDSITGDWIAAELPLEDLSNVNIDEITDGQILIYDAASSSFVASDRFSGGTFRGDVVGSVFGDDSTPIVDGINNTLTANTVNTENITTPNSLSVIADDGFTTLNVKSNEDAGVLVLTKLSSSDLSGTTPAYGRVVFAREDANGSAVTALISGTDVALSFGVDDAGSFTDSSNFFVWTGSRFGIGTSSPSDTLDVRGNIIADAFNGSILANDSSVMFDAINNTINIDVVTGDLIGSVFADDSSIIIDGIDGSINAQSFVQFGSLTTNERDELTAANGMVIYNTTNNKFEGYQNGAWINLDDGTAAS